MRAYLFLALYWLFITCHVSCSSPPPKIIINQNISEYPSIIRWIKFVPDADYWWLLEAKRRFKDPVVFICHGGYRELLIKNALGEYEFIQLWVAWPDDPRSPMVVESLAIFLHNLYPNNDVVLIICNENGFDISVPRVWYAKSLVWQVPDGRTDKRENLIGVGGVGNIYEFITEGKSPPSTQPTTKPTTQPTTNPTIKVKK